MPHTWTIGALRVLKVAEQIAGDSVDGTHVLWGFVSIETRGGELLRKHGFQNPRFAEAAELSLSRETLADTVAAVERLTEIDLERKHPAEVCAAAAELAATAGHDEVTSEHLLASLLDSDSVTPLLTNSGVNVESLRRELREQMETSSDPLPVDVRIATESPRGIEELNTYRAIDAAANRAREGLRVVEDFVRFHLNDAHLMRLLKSWRHDLRAAMGHVDASLLMASRFTTGDVGTQVSTAAEGRRHSSADVMTANFKRVQEAVRTLEEHGKLIASHWGAKVEQLRYRLYTLEKAVHTTVVRGRQFDDRRLYVLVTSELCRHDPLHVIRQAVEGGASVIQIREKTMPDRELLEFAKAAREITAARGVLFIMNDRPDLAVLSGADGVHVGQEELSVHDARRILGPDKLVGVSTHSIEQARRAVIDGADYLGVGPTFPSRTKSFDEFAGVNFVAEVAREITLPWFAIGGITGDNLSQVQFAGGIGVAVSGAICQAEDPAREAALLREKLARGRETPRSDRPPP